MRALRILGEVDLILCEDTRVTRKLLDRYQIKTAVESFHSHSKKPKVEKILSLLEAGKNLAYVVDAGTPGISDPGAALVARIRNELPEVKIVPVPGPSALTAALSVSGIPADEFVFFGFLPHKKGRQTKLKEIAALEKTVVLYESPHRVLKLLEKLAAVLEPGRKIVVARELTKIYEEVKIDTAVELLEYYKNNPDRVRGEFVVIIAPQ